MNGHRIAEALAELSLDLGRNEADTRHQILNRLLHEVLGWPHDSVKCEESAHEGYIDYVLRDRAHRPVLLIEAKREGKSFELPQKIPKLANDSLPAVRLRTLATDRQIGAAVKQAAGYCPAIGCQFACVTNGDSFILFRSFIPGTDFMDSEALVISSRRYFAERYTHACNLLGYESVTSHRSLHRAFEGKKGATRDLFYPKNGITHYDSPLQKNPYARFLEPITRRYFGELGPTDKRLMNYCYVFARGTIEVQEGIRARLADSLTPFFEADGAEDLAEVRGGGKLAQRIAKSLGKTSSGEVLILFGGKGAGKSTFLRRLLYHDPPPIFQIHGFPIIVDCLHAPQERDDLTRFLWQRITEAMDIDAVLARPIEQLLRLFEDRFSLAQKQELSGYTAGSSDYIRARNELVLKWKQDHVYVAQRLKHYWVSLGKHPVVAFDNTDQLPPALQDHCFLSAHSIARELRCTTIISMREERYCRARTTGVLDAYYNAGFHLAAPELNGVFTKRIKLVIRDLEDRKQLSDLLPENAPFDDLKGFFVACLGQFRQERNALRRFLEECSRHNTRRALEFFSQFLSSGYTHIEEMVRNPGWTVIEHQVIKPMMVPQRFNYDENKSLIPNVYQCRTPTHGSHFTMIRILRALLRDVSISPERSGYSRVDLIIRDFESKFGMREDCESALDVMLRHGLIEANNRLDAYSVEKCGGSATDLIYADEIRITAFGVYMLNDLSPTFTYLDLVSLDCGIADEALYHQFCNDAAAERAMSIANDKQSRLELRLKRTEQFIQYLRGEEMREKNEFLLTEAEEIVPLVERAFGQEKPYVLASAARNIPKLTRSRS